MKITDNILHSSVEQIADYLIEAGISSSKLIGTYGNSFIPDGAVIKFTDFEIKGERETVVDGVKIPSTRYIQLITDKGYVCSLSRLQASVFIGDPENGITEIQSGIHKGKFFLKTNTTPNPFLMGNQASALKKLVGKSFLCNHISGFRSIYCSEGYHSIDELQIEPYTICKLTEYKS
ncbi:hypothetical protein LX69_00587 [Breznakibacter xylanolyticus]|uniref:Uncharacterized protein n=1 Tax=Breznakibacter xylanolyticus TaxID=990 RepID=A0A2W7NU53_9BACT|nr:hypothetical protein [Breznakibacter xylanolyticus]PZX20134.1 hypothetical protein LX69_00587 [Breznakibacter xylanolyticus]